MERGRTIGKRPWAVAAAVFARLTRLRAYTVWPSTLHPYFVVDMSHPPSAAWLAETFEPEARRRRLLGAATWNALRTRALVAGRPSTLAAEALLRAGGPDVAGLRLALYSPTGTSLSKAACFVFEPGAAAPTVVVKAMPERRYSERLRHETEIVESVRHRIGPSSRTASALPLHPLYAGVAAGDYVVVQPVDPLAGHTGRLTDPSAALAWLREFHAATTTHVRGWDDADTDRALDAVAYAWRRARPGTADSVTLRARRLLNRHVGVPVPRSAEHGDFWRGNIAQRDGDLRVYDWEWARMEGTPFFDLWTMQLGPLRSRAEQGAADFRQPLGAALARVAEELGRRGLDPALALATLAPSLARLVFRVRRATGMAGGAEAESVRLMEAAEALLTGPGR
jgi:hypothetical protein